MPPTDAEEPAGEARTYSAHLPEDEYEVLRVLAATKGTSMNYLLVRGARTIIREDTKDWDIEQVARDATEAQTLKERIMRLRAEV